MCGVFASTPARLACGADASAEDSTGAYLATVEGVDERWHEAAKRVRSERQQRTDLGLDTRLEVWCAEASGNSDVRT